MRIDHWIMAGVGFVFDWGVTRKWKKVWPCFIPLVFLLGVASLSVWGASRKSTQLARWYEKLGEQEIEAWESSFAENSQSAGSESEQNSKVSPYAEMLFRRLQVIQPSERSRFIIGITYAQQGAFEQALPIFKKLAPAEKRGYAPAHAFLGMNLLQKFKTKEIAPTREVRDAFFHHLREAKRWEAAPQALLVEGSTSCFEYGRINKSSFHLAESFDLLTRAAVREPELNLELAKRAKFTGEERLFDQAGERAESHFRSQLEEDPNNEQARAKLAETLCTLERFEEAEQVVVDGLELRKGSELLTRQLSEVFRLRFVASFVLEDGNYVANVGFLDRAMKLDPANPYLSQEIAKLVRVGGMRPTDEMIANLQEKLASGAATPLTHAWISQAYLVREDYARALPHLQQVVTRMPTAPQFSNNLAYVLMELYPDRIAEAEQYAEQSVRIASARGHRNLPNFLDTLATIYLRQERLRESISVYEMAIELQPQNPIYHERIAEVLEQEEGGNELAAKHLVFAERLRQAQAEQVKGTEDPEGIEMLDPQPGSVE